MIDVQDLILKGTFTREYRKYSTEYSLNPAVGYSLNIIAELEKNDRILDPFCGTGTILIERQRLNPCVCVGLDINPKVLRLAKENIKAANLIPVNYYPNKIDKEFKDKIYLKLGDIRDQQFPENYFTKIISNLPYGIHSGSRRANIYLYQFLADKSINWLKEGGKAIFITNAKSLLKNAFEFNPKWIFIEEITLNLKGLNLSIFIFQKRSSPK